MNTQSTERPERSERMDFEYSLIDVLALEPEQFPERSAPTLERVLEVIGIVIDDKTSREHLAGEAGGVVDGTSGPRDPLSVPDAVRLAALLGERLDADQSALAAQLLFESELSTGEVIDLHKQYKIPVSHLEDDLLPVRGDGATIWDSWGRSYIDLDSNYSATNLGNSNPELAVGLMNQASLLVSQKEDRIQVARARFLKEIHGMLPEGLDRFYWQNSGGEAVDKTLKVAKAFTAHRGVIAFEGGFHGRTHGAVAVTYNEAYRKPFGLENEDWVHFAEFNNLDSVEKLLKEGKAKTVILELIQGEEGGMRPATPEFAEGLRKLCDDHGAVMIADEVQTGFGRVAEKPGQWFASHRYGVTPDIMAIGKSFGGGYPVTAVVTHGKISDKMVGGYDGSTFGGNPMAMTSALIATRQMKRLDLTRRTVERSKQFADGLSQIDSPAVKGFRTLGLMVAVDLDSADRVPDIQDRMKAHGAHSSLSTGSTLRWMPPLVISPEEVEVVLEAFRAALRETGA
ncbi:MAG: aminotransferase class III-fold pyridoxal phosphate-dependent enzyme [Candidatus Eisenbacteria bacterium]|nr:aminotransferase class III-fold pyridoxal phosphate-dependent enzyme [Candidatus Eisenbacteria bacterium]